MMTEIKRFKYNPLITGILFSIIFSGFSVSAQEKWQLVFSDEFERQEPGENWSLNLKAAGNWFIKNGKLTAEWTKNYDNNRLRNKNKNQYVKLDILLSSHIKKYFLSIVHFGIQFV